VNDAQATVLVFDDERAIRDVMVFALERSGFKVRAFDDAPDGLAWFDGHADEVLVVVLDRMLPSLSGEQVLQALKARRADVKVLVTSGYSDSTTEASMLALGASGFLGKPFRIASLVEAIEALRD
jgi:DNA-binding NtrC family response regulator